MFHNRLNFKIIFLLIVPLIISCQTKNKNALEEDYFERQSGIKSTDLVTIGDSINFWGADTPNGIIFIPNHKNKLLKAIGLKPESFQEYDKSIEELNKTIDTAPIYQIEVYEMDLNDYDVTNPEICKKINDNFIKAKIIAIKNNISLRVKERNWIELDLKINPEKLNVVRVGVGEPFSVIENKTSEAFFFNAQRSNKSWEEYSPQEKKEIKSWTCQETVFLEDKSFEALYFNPDIVFYYK